jgi:hypothetical protein
MGQRIVLNVDGRAFYAFDPRVLRKIIDLEIRATQRWKELNHQFSRHAKFVDQLAGSLHLQVSGGEIGLE